MEANYNRNMAIQLQAAGNAVELISSTEQDDYVSRIVKLIPAKSIVALVATEAAVSSFSDILVLQSLMIHKRKKKAKDASVHR